jgi:hypothetical protein
VTPLQPSGTVELLTVSARNDHGESAECAPVEFAVP